MVVKLSASDNQKLVDLLVRQQSILNPIKLRFILENIDLQTLTSQITPGQAADTLAMELIENLRRHGKNEYGQEALGLFLNALIDGNYINDQEEKQFLRQLVKNYNMMQPASLTPELPSSKTSMEVESNTYLEAIIGENTLRPIAFLLHAVRVSKAVCYVVVPGGSGSGFLVGDNLLLTNNHVIPDKNILNDCEFTFNYQIGINGKPEAPKTYRAKANGVFNSSSVSDLDYTLVELENSPGREWGYAKPLTEGSLRVKDRVNIIQHPGGLPKQISLQNNFVEYIDNKVLHYLTSTLPGSSGSPVFDDNWRLVALHHAGGNVVEPSTGRTYFRNEGIRMSAIMNHLPNDTGAILQSAQSQLL